MLLALGAALVGCGGGGGETVYPGEVSGVVFDADGYVVRGARIYTTASKSEAVSTTSGTYTLYSVPAEDVLIRAEIYKSNVRYYGQNLASVSSTDRAKNVNITLVPESQLATFRGQVRDAFGNRMRGIRVFVRPAAANTVLSSAIGITDSSGNFSIGGLMSGVSYTVQMNGLGYNSDFDSIVLTTGTNPSRTYNVPDGEITNVPAPSLTGVTAFTSPPATRSTMQEQNAIEALKARFRPREAQATSRTTVRGNPIEVDLFWDEISSTALLGYGIYRGRTDSALRNVGFLRDPQAVFFADNDDAIVEDVSYSYAISSLDTLWDGVDGESDPSTPWSVVPLGDLILGSVTPNVNPTFRWSGVAGAQSYGVYIFSQYPGIGVEELAFKSGITDTQFTYNDTNLTSGRTYYYVVYAERSTQQTFDTTSFANAYSFSQVGQFVVR